MKICRSLIFVLIGVLAFSTEGFSSSLSEKSESIAIISCVIPGEDMNRQSFHKILISEIPQEPGYANVFVREWIKLNYLVPPQVLPVGEPKESRLRLKLGEPREDRSIPQYYGDDTDQIQLSLHVTFDREDRPLEIVLVKASIADRVFDGNFVCSFRVNGL
jgi:hypothetical protein